MQLNENSKNAIAGAAVVIAGGIAAYLFTRKKKSAITTPGQDAAATVAANSPTYTPESFGIVPPSINLGDSPNFMTINAPPTSDLSKILNSTPEPAGTGSGSGCGGCCGGCGSDCAYTPFVPELSAPVIVNSPSDAVAATQILRSLSVG